MPTLGSVPALLSMSVATPSRPKGAPGVASHGVLSGHFVFNILRFTTLIAGFQAPLGSPPIALKVAYMILASPCPSQAPYPRQAVLIPLTSP